MIATGATGHHGNTLVFCAPERFNAQASKISAIAEEMSN